MKPPELLHVLHYSPPQRPQQRREWRMLSFHGSPASPEHPATTHRSLSVRSLQPGTPTTPRRRAWRPQRPYSLVTLSLISPPPNASPQVLNRCRICLFGVWHRQSSAGSAAFL